MNYIYDIHCHTSEVSSCGKVPAAELVRMYKEAGYSGVVITDHFNGHTAEYHKLTDWVDIVEMSQKGYKIAKELESDDFKVFYGMEIRFDKDSDNDYLLFGITPEWLLAHPFCTSMDDFDKFSELARADGILIIQAHPFRNNMTFVNPKYLDGVEAFNMNPRHNSRNDMAYLWSKKYDLIATSGSDFHQPQDCARGGIITKRKLESIDDLVSVLKNKDYSVIFKTE